MYDIFDSKMIGYTYVQIAHLTSILYHLDSITKLSQLYVTNSNYSQQHSN